MAVIEFVPLSLYIMLIGVILSTYLLEISALFCGGKGEIWAEEDFKLHAHYCLKKKNTV